MNTVNSKSPVEQQSRLFYRLQNKHFGFWMSINYFRMPHERKGFYYSHKFTNKTDKTAHILCLITPAGMEKMFEEIGKPVAPGTFLPRPKMTSEEQKQVQSIAERYGQTLYPPDYLD